MDNQNTAPQTTQEQPKKKGMNGCLIVLIVVGAFGFIIALGIAAAVAIPGFMAYTNASKSIDAKEDLRSISMGAISYFETEHMSEDGNSAITKQYPIANTAVCIGPDKPEVGAKFMLESDVPVFQDLHFMRFNPTHYSICYVSDGNSFTAKAFASLNSECDSAFTISGTSNGSISQIIELPVPNCDKPTL